MLTSHLHLAVRLRMSEVIHPFFVIAQQP